jgi:hypothetical protein
MLAITNKGKFVLINPMLISKVKLKKLIGSIILYMAG